MSDFRLRIVFVISLVILGLLAGFAAFHPFATGKQYSSIARESVLQTDDQWIIQFDIINQEDQDLNYNLFLSKSGNITTENVLVGKGRVYSHIRHIYLNTLKDTTVNLTVYKGGETSSFERVVYHLN